MTALRALALGCLLGTAACVPSSSNCDVPPGATFSAEPGANLSRSECEDICRSELMGAYPDESQILSCELEESDETEEVYYCEWEDLVYCG